MSVASDRVLESLDIITRDLGEAERRAREMEGELARGLEEQQRADLVSEIAQLNGEVGNLQCRRLDAVLSEGVVSGKREVRLRRKTLSQRCDLLLDCLERLHDRASHVSAAAATTAVDTEGVHSVAPAPAESLQWPSDAERERMRSSYLPKDGPSTSAVSQMFGTSNTTVDTGTPQALLLDAECAAERGDVQSTLQILAALTERLVVRANELARGR